MSIQDFTLAKEVKLGSYSYVSSPMWSDQDVLTPLHVASEGLRHLESWSQVANSQRIREPRQNTENVCLTSLQTERVLGWSIVPWLRRSC